MQFAVPRFQISQYSVMSSKRSNARIVGVDDGRFCVELIVGKVTLDCWSIPLPGRHVAGQFYETEQDEAIGDVASLIEDVARMGVDPHEVLACLQIAIEHSNLPADMRDAGQDLVKAVFYGQFNVVGK